MDNQRIMASWILVLVLLAPACGGPGSSPAEDGGPADAATFADGATDAWVDPQRNAARVFEINPVTTPDPVDVILEGVADDQEGHLTSAEDAQGVRKLRVFTCVDEGQTIAVPGLGERRICTLRQLANRDENGNFVYEDWELDVAGQFNPSDVHAEVSLYYHAQRIYAMITDPAVGVFDHLPGRHEVGGESVPINLVANYRLPASVDATQLSPAMVAFYIPAEHMQLGMAAVQGLMGYEGDFLGFGQATGMDFAYDGETVYHEFGHAIVQATFAPERVAVDRFGLTHLGSALNEGAADTFAFLTSGNATLYEYLEEHYPGFAMAADNDDRFPADAVGLSVPDGQSILGANWEVATQLQAAGLSRAQVVRVLLRTLLRLKNAEVWSNFTQYADAMLAVLQDEGHGAQLGPVESILSERGLFAPYREVDVTLDASPSGRPLFTGGASDAPWNTWLEREEGGYPVRIAPAYLQARVTVPGGRSELTLQVVVVRSPMDFSTGPKDLVYRLYHRQAQPVEYVPAAGGLVQVSCEGEQDPVVTPISTPMGEGDLATWTLAGLTEGETHYLHFVNYGDSEGLLFVRSSWQ